MKYTKEERLDIGRRIYDGEITKFQAAAYYGISDSAARDYMRLYRDTNGLSAKHWGIRSGEQYPSEPNRQKRKNWNP